ncbi:MAG: RNA polymerase sigma-70 factor [Bacteroidota bacterium]
MTIFIKPKIDVRTTSGFIFIYETYLDYVFDICYKYLGDEAVSENITSDIFAWIWDRRDFLYRESLTKHSWKRYLTRAAKNKVYDYLRGMQQSEKYIAFALQELPIFENTTEKETDFEELVQQISLAIDQLPAKCQEIFRLSREDGLSNKEISQKLGITDHAVKRQIAVALTKLRESLSEYSIPKRASQG